MRCRRRWKRGKARIVSINDRLIFNFQLDDTLEKTLRFVISLLMGDYSSARKRDLKSFEQSLKISSL